jgi:hypothetical protein
MRGIHVLLYLNVDNVGTFNVFGDANDGIRVSFRKLFVNLFYEDVFLGFDLVRSLILLFLFSSFYNLCQIYRPGCCSVLSLSRGPHLRKDINFLY